MMIKHKIAVASVRILMLFITGYVRMFYAAKLIYGSR